MNHNSTPTPPIKKNTIAVTCSHCHTTGPISCDFMHCTFCGSALEDSDLYNFTYWNSTLLGTSAIEIKDRVITIKTWKANSQIHFDEMADIIFRAPHFLDGLIFFRTKGSLSLSVDTPPILGFMKLRTAYPIWNMSEYRMFLSVAKIIEAYQESLKKKPVEHISPLPPAVSVLDPAPVVTPTSTSKSKPVTTPINEPASKPISPPIPKPIPQPLSQPAPVVLPAHEEINPPLPIREPQDEITESLPAEESWPERRARERNIDLDKVLQMPPCLPEPLHPFEILLLRYLNKRSTDLTDLYGYWTFIYELDLQSAMERFFSYGYLKIADIPFILSKAVVPDLKEFLAFYGKPTSGKKAILIDRILLEFPLDIIAEHFKSRYLQLTSAGERLIAAFPPLIFYFEHRHELHIDCEEAAQLFQTRDPLQPLSSIQKIQSNNPDVRLLYDLLPNEEYNIENLHMTPERMQVRQTLHEILDIIDNIEASEDCCSRFSYSLSSTPYKTIEGLRTSLKKHFYRNLDKPLDTYFLTQLLEYMQKYL